MQTMKNWIPVWPGIFWWSEKQTEWRTAFIPNPEKDGIEIEK